MPSAIVSKKKGGSKKSGFAMPDLSSPIETPDREYIQLRLTKDTMNKTRINETIIMEKLDKEDPLWKQYEGEELFKVTRGGTGRAGFIRVGQNKARIVGVYDMSVWDEMYQYYTRGCKDPWTYIPGRMVIKELGDRSTFKEIADEYVRSIVDFLMMAANKVVEESYTVQLADISKDMLDAGQSLLNYMADNIDTISVAEFNACLLKLWTIIPRPIRKMSKEKVLSKDEFAPKLQKEQELLNFMFQSLQNASVYGEGDQTILDANNVEMRPATQEEIDTIIRPLLGSDAFYLSRAWKVTNKKTDEAFNKYLDEVYDKKHKVDPKFERYSIENEGIHRLFHGSRTHNWWSIICNGLYINPNEIKDLGHKADYCGSAFGHGIYTAPSAHKSMGYTDFRGAHWTNGQNEKGYLAIFQIATGEIYDIYGEGNGTPNSYKELQNIHPGADCTWAFARDKNGYAHSYLRNEEVIVYRQDQANIDFLIEYTYATVD